MRVLRTGLRIHQVPTKGRDCMSSAQNIRWRDETVPLGGSIRVDELQTRDAKIRESVLVGGVLFKPTDPKDLDFLSRGIASEQLLAFVVDGNREDVDKSAVSIWVGVIAFGSSDHDIRARSEVDNIGVSLEVVCCIVDAKRFVNGDFATPVNIGIEHIPSGGFVVLNQQP